MKKLVTLVRKDGYFVVEALAIKIVNFIHSAKKILNPKQVDSVNYEESKPLGDMKLYRVRGADV